MKTVCLVALVALSGCVTTRATTSPNANLSQYRTFGWYQPPNPTQNQIAFEQGPSAQTIKNELARNFAQKGLTEVSTNPELLVSYHVKTQQKYDVTDWGYPGGWWYGWGYPGGVSVNEYTQGTIFVDLIDPKTNQIVWRGTASAVVNHPENPNQEKIAKSIDKLMKKLPASQFATAPSPARM